MTSVTEIVHPLVGSKLTELRDTSTSTPRFRSLLNDIGTLLVPAATAHLPVETRRVDTPLEPHDGVQLAGGPPVLISVLRAGNGLLDGMLRVLDDVDVGHIGLVRNHETLTASQYMVRFPALAGRHALVLDPMLATGGSAIAALDLVVAESPASVVLVCLVAAPEGIAAVEAAHPEVDIVTAAIDSHLNDVGYIVPGLGDAGDRLYGT